MRRLVSFIVLTGLAVTQALAQTPAAGPRIDLQDALRRARSGSPQYLAAALDARSAHEDRVQARAGLLPSVSYNNQYAYTKSNGEGAPVFVGSDGIHVYSSQINIHDETLSLTHNLEYRRAIASEAVARARQDVVVRGLSGSVLENYYAVVAASRKVSSAAQSLQSATAVFQTTERLENGGEVARADVVKSQILVQQRQRDLSEAQLALYKARVALAVLIFPDFDQDFSVVDDVETVMPIGPLDDVLRLSRLSSPELHVADNALRQEVLGVSLARSEFVPSVSVDYFYGINANRFAARTDGISNVGSAVQATVNIPIFNWGATRSRIRQAENRRQQADLELQLTAKQLSATAAGLYREADVARTQLESLRTSLDLASESVRLTLLQYQAGESTVLEVVDAQTTLTDARNAYDEGLVRCRTAWANIQLLMGNL